MWSILCTRPHVQHKSKSSWVVCTSSLNEPPDLQSGHTGYALLIGGHSHVILIHMSAILSTTVMTPAYTRVVTVPVCISKPYAVTLWTAFKPSYYL